MAEEWIQGRFEGVYTGERRPGDPADPPGARRFGFEIESGVVTGLELIAAPLDTDLPGEQKQLRQERVKRVRLPLVDGEAPRERPLFDVRIRDWKLMHPAEHEGRSFGTVVGRQSRGGILRNGLKWAARSAAANFTWPMS